MDAFNKGILDLPVANTDTIEEKYAWVTGILTQSRYQQARRKDRSIVRRFLRTCTGYTDSHLDHLITEFKKTGRITRKARDCATEFATVYTRRDISLLAEVSEAFFHQNGRALVNVCKDMYHQYGDDRFERLAQLSVSHLYNLRKTQVYKQSTTVFTKTQATTVAIGERRKPFPEGIPGYIRVDSVHQGDRDKEKGVYHIHLIDEVTQWDITVTVQGISYHYLEPALMIALAEFPFHLVNFHSDNGSEFINHQVADLLNRLSISQTKSRSRRTNDQALVEGKHAVTVRPVFGKMHIPKHYAEVIDVFNREYLHDFVNFHRKCGFASEVVRPDGKIVKRYQTEDFMTPCEKLCSIPNVERYLRDDITVAILRERAAAKSHLKAAQDMQKARSGLFKKINA